MKLFNQILSYKKTKGISDHSIMELVVSYAEAHELDVEEIGEELKKDKTFVKMFQQDLIRNNEARFRGVKKETGFDGWV